jgi:hypothetical protein
MSGALDRGSQHPLMPGARPGAPAGHNLASIRQKIAQQIRLLIVNVRRLLLTEQAVLSSPTAKPAPAPGTLLRST